MQIPGDCLRAWSTAARLIVRPSTAVTGTDGLELPKEPDAVAAARRAAAVLVLSMTPGTVVVDSDPERRIVSVHRFGAHPGAVEKAVRR